MRPYRDQATVAWAQPARAETKGIRISLRKRFRVVQLLRPHQHLDVLVFLMEQAVVSLADKVVESDMVCDEQVAAKAWVGHHANGFIIKTVAAHASRDGFLAEDDVG